MTENDKYPLEKVVIGDKGHDAKPLSQLPKPKREIPDALAGKYDDGPEPPFFTTLFLAIRVLQGDRLRDDEIRTMLYGELDAITYRLSNVLQDFKVALVDYFANETQQSFVNEIVGLGKLYRHQNLVLHFIAHGKTSGKGISRGDKVDVLQDEQLGELIENVCASLNEKVLVFFNLCYSDALACLVSGKINGHGATIGYDGKLPEPLAKEFSARFYCGAFVERKKWLIRLKLPRRVFPLIRQRSIV